MQTENVIPLCLREAISLDVADTGTLKNGLAQEYAEDTIEDMVVCLAAVEASWVAGEFARLGSSLGTLQSLAAKAGLPDVVFVTKQARELMQGYDETALAAVIARLIRVGETSLAALLEISYRQI